MKICLNELLLSFSNALDFSEREYYINNRFHGKRVAYFCLLLGEYLQLNNEDMNNLFGCAILHDNGLTEYPHYKDQVSYEEFLKRHCVDGENNVAYLSFYSDVKDVILYHHEEFDGSGPFSKKEYEIPLFSQLIHIIDWADLHYCLYTLTQEEYTDMIQEMNQLRNHCFSSHLVEAFIATITYQKIKESQTHLDELIRKHMRHRYLDFNQLHMMSICQLLANVIDSKSPHTKTHSIGVAAKASKMGVYYHYNEDMLFQLFFTGTIHDIGKLIIDRDILEKPEKLTKQEYAYIQTHAFYTYELLQDMQLGDILHWASYHHEKLDGSGYPFGKKADELDFIDRLIACCDIYQALREERPYKKAKTHNESINIMRDMANDYKIDAKIVEDMNIAFQEI